MKQRPLTDLSDEQLLRQHKKTKNGTWFSGFAIGFLIGVAIYSTINNGLSFWTFFPLFFILIFVNNAKQHKEAKEELSNRNIN